MRRPAIDPVVWHAPPTPERARWPTSAVPLPALTLLPVPGTGPEDVAVDADGRLLTGLDDGRILRLSPDGRLIETLADTGGRPLGIEVAGDGSLIVCDASRGLLRVDPAGGGVEILVDSVDGVALLLCDNAAVAADGTVFFSDSSRRFSLEHWKADLLEHSGTGRLLRRSPEGDVDVLCDGLQFANGVALAPDESFVVVAETGGYRLTRVWLTGDRVGAVEPFVENLPAFPDNVSTGTDGLLWIAMASPRKAAVDRLGALPPVVRKVVWALPEGLQPSPTPTVWVYAVDRDGRLVHDLQGDGGSFATVTGVREHDGTVHLGSLQSTAVASFRLPDPDHEETRL